MPWPSTVNSFAAVIITGGSSGIGAAFIRTIRNIGSKVLICNISRTIPCEMEANFELSHRPTDLSRAEEVAAAAGWVKEQVKAAPDGPVLLINNAGYGLYGTFGNQPIEKELGMIDLNIRAVVDFSHRLLPLLHERGGRIINVASLAAFQPLSYMSTYAATKAFVLHWSLALNEELRGSDVRALAVCPGPTESQFFLRAGFSEPPRKTKGQTAEAVVEESFRALHRGRAMVVTGAGNRWIARLPRLFSKPLIARLGRRVIEKLRLSDLQSSSSSQS